MDDPRPWEGNTQDWSDEEVAIRLAVADAIAQAIEAGLITEISPGVYQRLDT